MVEVMEARAHHDSRLQSQSRSGTRCLTLCLAFMIVALALAAWLAHTSLWSMLLVLAVLYSCCFSPARAVFHTGDRSPDIWEGTVYLLLGLGALGLLSIGAASWGLSPESAMIPPLLFSLYFVGRHRSIPGLRHDTPVLSKRSLPLLVVCASYLGMPVIACLRMGMGEYPHVFMNVDSAYYLGQVHSLIRHDVYPPPFLEFLGSQGAYHHGTQAMAAILSRLSGIGAHHSMFLFVIPLLLMGTFAAGVLLVRQFSKSKIPLWLGVTIVFFISFFPAPGIFEGVERLLLYGEKWKIYRTVIGSPELYDQGVPMSSTQYGVFAALVILWCMSRTNEGYARRLIAYTIGTLVFFKSPHFVGLGLGLAGWSITHILFSKDAKPLVVSSIGLGLAIILRSVIPSVDTTVRSSLLPFPGYHLGSLFEWQFGSDIRSATRLFLQGCLQLTTLLPFVIPALAVWRLRSKPAYVPEIRSLIWFITLPFVFVNAFALKAAVFSATGRVDASYSANILQSLFLARYVGAVMVLLYVSAHWEFLEKRCRRMAISLILVAVAHSVTHAWYGVAVVLVAPEAGHEYIDNTEIAEALRAIPLEGSVLVTNDFRYRTASGIRELRQFQLTAVYGHQCYASVFSYGHAGHPEAAARFEQQRRFRRTQWDSGLIKNARQYGWTHLLLDRSAPAPDSVPLPLVFENDGYRVYRFPQFPDQANSTSLE